MGGKIFQAVSSIIAPKVEKPKAPPPPPPPEPVAEQVGATDSTNVSSGSVDLARRGTTDLARVGATTIQSKKQKKSLLGE